METEVTVIEFLSKMTKDVDWQLTLDAEIRRYKLNYWTPKEIVPKQWCTPDILDLSNADFKMLTTGLQEISEKGAISGNDSDTDMRM